MKAAVAEAEKMEQGAMALPEEEWIRQRLVDLAELLKNQMPQAAQVLRPILGKIVVEPVVQPGKQRGCVQLRVTIQGSAMLLAALKGEMSAKLQQMLEQSHETGETFVLPVGRPTNMDVHGSTVVALRREGKKWKEIAAATGLKPQNACMLYKRLTTAEVVEETPPKNQEVST